MCIYIYVFIFIYTHIYTHTYVYIYIYTHTYTPECQLAFAKRDAALDVGVVSSVMSFVVVVIGLSALLMAAILHLVCICVYDVYVSVYVFCHVVCGGGDWALGSFDGCHFAFGMCLCMRCIR